MAIVYDSRNLTWDTWCARMAELFAANQLGTVPENEWTLWASALAGIGYFTQSGCPDPRGFTNWRDWAEQMTGSMNLAVPNKI
jgi:hypothetical protein